MTALKKSDAPRYEFRCVAPEVYGGPAPTDDVDEARLAAALTGNHWEVWDTVERRYVPPIMSVEEEAEVRARANAKLGDGEARC